MVPIFTDGEIFGKSNSKPVNLMPKVDKILEFIMSAKIREHLEKYSLITFSQQGFLYGFSCLTILLSFYSKII